MQVQDDKTSATEKDSKNYLNLLEDEKDLATISEQGPNAYVLGCYNISTYVLLT